MAKNEELIISNLQDSVARVKAMVNILYVPETLTVEKVKALARIAKLNLDIGIEGGDIEGEVFNNLQEVADFLIDTILNHKIIDDLKDGIDELSSQLPK